MISTSVTIDDILSLMQDISLQPIIQKQLHYILTTGYLAENTMVIAGLTDPDTSFNTWNELENLLSQHDPNGIQLLAVYLSAACMTKWKYQEAGVSESVYIDTMKCFPRYLQDEYERTGKWAFTRGFWTWRHLCCLMFRLGTLEFEYSLLKSADPRPKELVPGNPVLFVHIPSDVRLMDEDLQLSYHMARNFFKGTSNSFCIAGRPKAMLCNTWLLSPELQKLLLPSSGIRRFARDYMIYAANPEDDSFYLWLYQGKRPPQPLPLETSLQRTVYEHLGHGGKIGDGHGLQTDWKICNPILIEKEL